jgi:hypothetical protein
MTKDEAIKEIRLMGLEYELWGYTPFLVGSSICGNKDGDSKRFWDLKKKFNI